MLDSIFIGMSGLAGYSRGLHVIANNSANLNTPGFKSASLQFADQFYSSAGMSGGAAGSGSGQVGNGLNTYGTHLNFTQGELRQTGNDLDLAVDGNGMFVLKDTTGQVRYTRAGQFEFNADGVLVTRTDGTKVMASGTAGALTAVDLAGLRTNAASPTKTVTLTGNISSTEPSVSVGGVKVIDAAGTEHSLSLKLTNNSATAAGQWQVELLDGTTSVGTAVLTFTDGAPTAGTAKLSFTYKPVGLPEMPLVFDFSANVTSFAGGSLSTLAFAKQDGYAAGTLSKVSFDTSGILTLAYSNGQTVKGAKLALASFDSPEAVESDGNNSFVAKGGQAWTTGTAGTGAFGTIRSGTIEISNVDLSQEFSDLVIMQRGYQASSQIVSTANDMIQELFSMKNK
jgi:flagellar hook protein FlgE